MIALASAGLVGLVLLLALGLDRGGAGSATGCELERLSEQESSHPPAPPPGFTYNSSPPTSGPSDARPLVWNAYRRSVSQYRLVHNLLHGGVAVQYGSAVPDETVAELAAWYRSDPDGLVLAPRPELGDRIALTAWTRLASCSTFLERPFTRFRTLHRFKAPETQPREAMRPGRGGVPNPLALAISPRPVRERAVVSLVFAEPAGVSIDIRAGRPSGPIVRRLANLGLVPNVRVQLLWDRRDDQGQRVSSGTYAVVARLSAPGKRLTAAAAFEVR